MQYTKGSSVRKADYPIDKIFLDRWSPRAMSPNEEVSDEELFTLFEAARWAPSSNNEQPWRFIYAKKGTKEWDKFYNLLDDFNQLWNKNSAVLVCLIAKKNFTKNNEENRNHLSDTGSAWENLFLQATLKGLVCHGMAGYNIEEARKELHIPDNFEIVHMFAIGRPGDKEVLPERMQKSETPKLERKPVTELASEGRFTDKIA